MPKSLNKLQVEKFIIHCKRLAKQGRLQKCMYRLEGTVLFLYTPKGKAYRMGKLTHPHLARLGATIGITDIIVIDVEDKLL